MNPQVLGFCLLCSGSHQCSAVRAQRQLWFSTGHFASAGRRKKVFEFGSVTHQCSSGRLWFLVRTRVGLPSCVQKGLRNVQEFSLPAPAVEN